MNPNKCYPDAFAFENSQNGGMTKREYFAAAALQGLLATSDPIMLLPNQTIADIAVEHSDKLISALNGWK